MKIRTALAKVAELLLSCTDVERRIGARRDGRCTVRRFSAPPSLMADAAVLGLEGYGIRAGSHVHWHVPHQRVTLVRHKAH